MPTFHAGNRVRYIDGRTGEITGSRHGSKWEVSFGAAVSIYCEEDFLESAEANETPEQAFKNRHFNGVDAVRRAVNRHRLSGELTNVVFAMDNAKTSYMPHQFVPVLKFLSSRSNRLLIADEVGLGKTIEAMYIWEELRARENARRLLVVAPAVLREKWQKDMKAYFGIDAQIVSAENDGTGSPSLHSRVVANQNDFGYKPFALIVSLQGLRVANGFREYMKARGDDAEPLFDLAIIDEAHYMRNDTTESFRAGAEIRDVSANLLLLSATPIQTGSDNLFNLLRLLSPEEFFNRDAFFRQIMDNVPLVRLANALESNRPRNELLGVLHAAETVADKSIFELRETLRAAALPESEIQGIIAAARRESAHRDAVFADIDRFANDMGSLPDSREMAKERFRLIQRVKRKYFYDGYVSRMRKRDVFEERPVRHVATIEFRLSPLEKAFYDLVSAYIELQDFDQGLFSSFRLIARQRQMASCMASALRSWRGGEDALGATGENDFGECAMQDEWQDNDAHAAPMPRFETIDIAELERADGKFETVFESIMDLLQNDPTEKIIVFSFFRGTVLYLARKFAARGLSVTFILGGMTAEEKQSRIESFRNGGASVLVSSEVGSEGIDLQFARTVVNYDLPWNPMRVEQRIGRIDRIGQKSKDLFVFNVFCHDTVEDRILSRLYARIEEFKDVIGDLEEILGKTIADIELQTFRDHNRYQTEEDLEKRATQAAEQIETALARKAVLSRDLSLQAGMLSAYQKFVLDGIDETRRNRRIVSGEAIRREIMAFLHRNYPGTSLVAESGVERLSLSPEARRAFSDFIKKHPFYPPTDMHRSVTGVYCRFGGDAKPGPGELVTIRHPLVKWIVDQWELRSPEAGSVQIPASRTNGEIPAGRYVYRVDRWEAKGIRNENELHVFVCRAGSDECLAPDHSERLLACALENGVAWWPERDTNEVVNADEAGMDVAKKAAWKAFDGFEAERKAENLALYDERVRYIDAVYDGKVETQRETVKKLESEGKQTHLQEGQIRKLEKQREAKKAELSSLKTPVITNECVSCGVIVVEED